MNLQLGLRTLALLALVAASTLVLIEAGLTAGAHPAAASALVLAGHN